MDHLVAIVVIFSAALGGSLLTYTLMFLKDRESPNLLKQMLPAQLVASNRVRQMYGATLVKENLQINIYLVNVNDLVEARVNISYVMRNLSTVAQTFSLEVATDKSITHGQLTIDGRVKEVEIASSIDTPAAPLMRFDQVIKPASLVSVNRSFAFSRKIPFLEEVVESSIVVGGMRVAVQTQIKSDILVRIAGPSNNMITTLKDDRLGLFTLNVDELLLPGDTLLIGVGINDMKCDGLP